MKKRRKIPNPISFYADELREELEQRGNTPKYPLKSLPEFSEMIWGLKEGLTVLGARTANGKSAMAVQLAWDLATQGFPVLFLSLEMTEGQIVERLFSHVTGIHNTVVQHNGIEVYVAEYVAFQQKLFEVNIQLSCDIGKTFEEVYQTIASYAVKPRVVVIDYVQGVLKQGIDYRHTLNDYIKQFRDLMLLNKSVGILCSQVGRGAKEDKGEPTLWTLKETGALEEAADMVLLLHWAYIYTNNPDHYNKIDLYVAKNRNGRTGRFQLQWEPKTYRYSDILPEEEISFEEAERRYK